MTDSTPPILHPNTTSSAQLIAHGAEALLYKTTGFAPSSSSSPSPAALKYRPPKSYRHPVLDARLTRHRILSEARILARCRRDGVPVPGILAIDEAAGWLLMEWVAGEAVRAAINRWLDESERGGGGTEPLRSVLRRIGEAVGALHRAGVVHGDLTTSNMMLRPLGDHADHAAPQPVLAGDVVIIDFGLATQSSHEEDRAVDLYVLERAFGSTHPSAEHLFAAEVITAYAKAYKGAPAVLKRLDEVRMRGRKRTMIG